MSMSDELFTSTPPTEPGWYWIKSFNNDVPEVREICRMKYGELFLFADDLNGPESKGFDINKPLTYHLRKANVQYGPRVPSPEVCALHAAVKL